LFFFHLNYFLITPTHVGNGLDVDEYVRRAYKFAYSEGVEVGPVACLPEPPDPNELYPRQSRRFVQVLAFSLVWTIIMEQIIVRC
jgi:hypothetical protein